MGMSDEMMRKMDKRSKEEKKEMVGRIMTEKAPNMRKNHREDKSGMLAKIWGVVRKWIEQRNPE